MNSQLRGNEEGLVAYLPLNESSGTTTKDGKGNGQDGKIMAETGKKVETPLEETLTVVETVSSQPSSQIGTKELWDNKADTSSNNVKVEGKIEDISSLEASKNFQSVLNDTQATTDLLSSKIEIKKTIDSSTNVEPDDPKQLSSKISSEAEAIKRSTELTTSASQKSLSTSIQEQQKKDMAAAKNPKYKILSIDGGGIRGIIPAIVLAEIEKRTKKPIFSLFDLISGTSTGGVLALGLTKPDPNSQVPTAKYTAEELISMYLDYGGIIFYESFFEKILGPLEDLAQPKYSSVGREEVITDFLGHTPLKDCLKEVFVTSYDIEKRLPVFFTSNLQKQQIDSPMVRKLCTGFSLKDAAMATSAAPTFFAPYQVSTSHNNSGFYTLVDGGMVANNPTSLAIMEAQLTERKKGAELSMNDVLVVSLGTGSLTSSYPYDEVKNWGLLQWVQPLINIIFDGSSEMVAGQLERLLEPRGVEHQNLYYRFQTFLTGENEAMDNARPENIKALEVLAKRLIEETSQEIDQLCEVLTK